MWSNDPWEIPIVSISIKQINGEIIKLLFWSRITEEIFTSKKNINEW